MPVKNSDKIPLIHLLGDLLLLNGVFFCGNALHHGSLPAALDTYYLNQYLYLNLFWAASTSIMGVYRLYRVMRVGSILQLLFKAFVLHLFFVFSFLSLLEIKLYSLHFFASKYLVFIILLLSWRVGFIYFLKYMRAQGYNFRRVVIAGGGPVGNELFDFFRRHPEHGYRCMGFFCDKAKNMKVLGNLDDIEEYSITNKVDEIYISLPDLSQARVKQLMDFADNNLIRVKLLPDFRSLPTNRVEISFYQDTPVLTIRKEPLEDSVNRIMKRAFDIVFSSLVILLIFPWLIPAIAIAIKLSSNGPVLFKQLRSGRGNEAFYCYKFRTMRVNKLADQLQATRNDPRITRVGAFLRKTSLDELPQFFNVLIGNMSVVGPRPHMLSHTEKYGKEINKFMARHLVKAGITGLAQVKGCRGETTNPKLMENRVKWDLWYIENWSFFFDIQIIYMTISEMLKGKIKGA